jgi:Na+-driven multidrug efflux pump
MITSIVRQLVVLLPAALVLAMVGGINAVWWAFPIAEVFSLILAFSFLRFVMGRDIQPLYQKTVEP